MTIFKFILAGLNYIITAICVLGGIATWNNDKKVVALMIFIALVAAASGLTLMLP